VVVSPAVVEAIGDGLAPMVGSMVTEALEAMVPSAVAAAAGRVAPQTSPESAAAAVVDELAVTHEHDLAAGENDLRERLAAKHGPDFLHHPAVMNAIDWVAHQDRGAHGVARHVLERDLAEVFAGPVVGREQRVRALLDGERERMKGRARTRVARATQAILASVPTVDPDAPLERS
jgi:hypothetical protein